MSIINPTYNVLLDSLVLATWSNMTTGDTANPHFVRGKPDLVSVQAEGTFSGGTTVKLQGSVAGVTYSDAKTAAMGNLAITANTASGILEAYPYWKPTIASGSSDNVTITMSYWIRE